jgi:hypothetical protein
MVSVAGMISAWWGWCWLSWVVQTHIYNMNIFETGHGQVFENFTPQATSTTK